IVLVQRESYNRPSRLSNFWDGFFKAWATSLESFVRRTVWLDRPPIRLSVEAATGYPLAGCSPAEPASVSPGD
ncbi:MAG: hypothetical protein KAG97_12285, partial [Victivallales bacterium]|nr:hypothetical protein [Victivallales bacterium]